jgi:hypothetical protein
MTKASRKAHTRVKREQAKSARRSAQKLLRLPSDGSGE